MSGPGLPAHHRPSGALARRDAQWRALGAGRFDVLVIGGGITGAGVARDAALRGLRVALVEKEDFAYGTSSRSTKLVHGGLRYLEQGALKLVFESVNERKRLLEVASHLVRPQRFFLPHYRSDRRALTTLDAGLWLYEALCLFDAPELHQTLDAERTLEQIEGLRAQDLTGALTYSDCVTDDARLTLANLLDVPLEENVVLNHVRAATLVRDTAGTVRGADVEDTLTGARTRVEARVVVNATGPWCDALRPPADGRALLKPTLGVHIVLPRERLPVPHALTVTSPEDGRVMFILPWEEGSTVVGTTDSFFSGSPDALVVRLEDADYLLRTANHYFPAAQLGIEDITSTWAGLRPLLAPAHADGEGASALSREHHILEEPGLLTVAGGKLTTYRIMARQIVDAALRQLTDCVAGPCVTGERPLPGAEGECRLPAGFEAWSRHAQRRFGARAAAVLDAGERRPISERLPFLWCEVDHAVHAEFALTLEDVMVRRLPFLLRASDRGEGVASAIAAHLAGLLGWSESETRAQQDAYLRRAKEAVAFREAA